jgi:hypothetical protein
MTGIIVQHGHRQPRNRALVRCDVTAFIGFALPNQWPEGYQNGDFVEILIRGEREFQAYSLRHVFDRTVARAVRNFFMNGGDEAHVFAICINSMDELTSPMMNESLVSLFHRLEAEEDISLLNVPSLAYLPCQMLANGDIICGSERLYSRLLLHCSQMNNRFLIMDAPKDLHDEFLVRWIRRFRGVEPKVNSYGAIYYPWLCERDEFFPPGSAVAGLYVEVEKLHPPIGIQWPPANLPLRGITHSTLELDQKEVSALSQEYVNAIYTVSGRGIMPMGARTLSNEPIFKQINSRRIMNLIVEQIRRDSRWAVFEVNNPHLWSVVSRDVRSRLEEFWNAGLLRLSDSGEKYSVTCNAENNPSELVDAGYINVEVRLQPVGTTEQILVDLNIGGL